MEEDKELDELHTLDDLIKKDTRLREKYGNLPLYSDDDGVTIKGANIDVQKIFTVKCDWGYGKDNYLYPVNIDNNYKPENLDESKKPIRAVVVF